MVGTLGYTVRDGAACAAQRHKGEAMRRVRRHVWKLVIGTEEAGITFTPYRLSIPPWPGWLGDQQGAPFVGKLVHAGKEK